MRIALPVQGELTHTSIEKSWYLIPASSQFDEWVLEWQVLGDNAFKPTGREQPRGYCQMMNDK